MQIKTDQELVIAYHEGDEQAFHILIKRHMNGAFRCALGFCHDYETAEDITQEAFVKVWKNIGSYNPKYAFSTWISAITKNTALDFMKKKYSLPFSSFENQDSLLLEAGGISNIFNSGSIGNSDPSAKMSVDEALSNLSDKDRSIIELHYEQGYTFEEIGKKMDRPMNTVKTWHRRALQRLKGSFK
jgi:RNA polymerase sigma-70 factor (ECF subfamily)